MVSAQSASLSISRSVVLLCRKGGTSVQVCLHFHVQFVWLPCQRCGRPSDDELWLGICKISTMHVNFFFFFVSEILSIKTSIRKIIVHWFTDSAFLYIFYFHYFYGLDVIFNKLLLLPSDVPQRKTIVSSNVLCSLKSHLFTWVNLLIVFLFVLWRLFSLICMHAFVSVKNVYQMQTCLYLFFLSSARFRFICVCFYWYG